MTFTPLYDTRYIEPIVDNIQAYLEAGEVEAFFWANNGPGLKPTAVWRKSRWFNTLFPVTSVIPVKTIPAEEDDRGKIDEKHVITVEIEVDGNNPDAISKSIMRRINAYDQLLRKIEKQQLLNGLNLTTAGGEWLDIGEHNYSYWGQQPTLYKLIGRFDLTVSVIEGRHRT